MFLVSSKPYILLFREFSLSGVKRKDPDVIVSNVRDLST